jgi:site-specific recombinase XerD
MTNHHGLTAIEPSSSAAPSASTLESSRPIDANNIDEFCSHITAWGCSHNTVRAYRTDLSLLIAEHPTVNVATFTDTAAMWMTENRSMWSASTTNRRIASFNKFAKWLKIPGLQDYRRPKSSIKPYVGISIADVNEVLRLLRESDHPSLTNKEILDGYALISMCGLSGLRIHEATEVVWDDFNSTIPGRTVTLRIEGKGSRERFVPFPTSHHSYMSSFGSRRIVSPHTVDSARYLIHKIFASCGYPRVQSHQLRHAFATAAYNSSHDIIAVQRLMGHSEVTTTQRYIDSSFDAGASIVAGIGEM